MSNFAGGIQSLSIAPKSIIPLIPNHSPFILSEFLDFFSLIFGGFFTFGPNLGRRAGRSCAGGWA